MTNLHTHKPITVLGGETGYPTMSVPVEQLERVRQLFDANGVVYYLNPWIGSWDNGPKYAYIQFKRGTDKQAVQRLLDSV